MIATMGVMSYYCSIMALTVFYFFASFAKTLPWNQCDEKWVTQGLLESCPNGTENVFIGNTSLPELYFV